MRATVPTPNRASPPLTSEPRSISTTPNSWSVSLSTVDSIATYRGSKTRSCNGRPGNSTEPSGNIANPRVAPVMTVILPEAGR